MTASNLDELLRDLEAARADLLESVADVPQEAFVARPAGAVTAEDERWNVRDVLWHVGLLDDWYRLLIDQALGGRPLAAWNPGRRPAHLNTPELLRAWLAQTRGALLARAGRLSDGDLDAAIALAQDDVRSPRGLLVHLAWHDRAHASQVRALLGGEDSQTAFGPVGCP